MGAGSTVDHITIRVGETRNYALFVTRFTYLSNGVHERSRALPEC